MCSIQANMGNLVEVYKDQRKSMPFLQTFSKALQFRKFRRSWLICLYFFTSLILILSLHRTASQAQVTTISQAKITEILEGNQVYIQNRQAQVNDTARSNEQVRTGQARAQVQFNNKAIARLSRNSSMTIGQCGAQLERGSVLINGAASACTSTITAAVRGTTYVLEIDDQGEEQLRVLEGEVEVSDNSRGSRDRFTIRGGQKLQARSGRVLPQVLDMPQSEYEGILTGSLIRGYRDDLRSLDRIERTFNRRFPGARFPLRSALNSPILNNPVLNPLRGHFSLAILQDRPQLSQVIARVTLKSRRANGYLAERFAGDYLYPINKKAQFIRGLNPSDRIVVRLFTPQDRLIGYSEFELLEDNAAVSIVLPEDSNLYGTVRTIVGIDADRNGVIDRGVPVYDYFSQLIDRADRPTVTFQPSIQDFELRAFNFPGLQTPPRNAIYPPTMSRGFVDRDLEFNPDDLDSTITALPRQLVQPVNVDFRGTSVYDVTRQILNFRRK